MNIQKEIWIVTNYDFIVASEEVLWRLLMFGFGWMVSDYMSWWKIKEQYHKSIPWLIREFRNMTIMKASMLEKHIKIRSWHNIVPLVLRESFASLICWNTVTPTFEANYFALWNDNTVASNADTILWNETLRWLFTDRYNIENVAYLDKFFSSSEVGWNSYLEAGVFVDGTWSADTWYLLSRILITESMSVNETLTINCSFTIS